MFTKILGRNVRVRKIRFAEDPPTMPAGTIPLAPPAGPPNLKGTQRDSQGRPPYLVPERIPSQGGNRRPVHTDFDADPPDWDQLTHPSTSIRPISDSFNEPTRHILRDGRTYYVKRYGAEDDPQGHAEVASSRILRTLGFKDIPPAHKILRPDGALHATITPHVDGRELYEAAADDASARKIRSGNKEKDVANWLAGTWLVNADDRHHGNYRIGTDGKTVHPLDFGYSLHPHPVHHMPGQGVIGWGNSHDALLGEGFARPDSEIDKGFLKKILSKQKQILDDFHSSLAGPDVDPRWRDDALAGLEQRLDHAKHLASSAHPIRLRDLPETHRVPYHKNGNRGQIWVH